jgi:pimeloyl-ACP methyl ester carboxylesterase
MDTWRFIVEDLKKDHRLILVDLKGHGFSDKPRDARYSLQDHAEIVTGLIEHLRLSQVILVGHSLGSVTAVVTALRAQQSSKTKVSGVVLIAGSLDPGTLPHFLRLLRLPIFGWLTMKLTTASFRTRLALRKSIYEKDKITDSWVELYAKYQRITGTEYALLKTVEQMIPQNSSRLKEDVRTLRIPVLNILGEHDEIIPRESGEGVCRLLPRCTRVVVEGVGHIPHEEKPTEIIQLLRDFLHGP